MPEFAVSVQLEAESLRDLRALLEHAKQQSVALVLIGGYAARAYTKPAHYRGTKDIDFITQKTGLGSLKGLLKELGYDIQTTPHGLKALKRVEHGEIKLDIAVGAIIDDSTGKAYTPRPESIANALRLMITAFYEENASLNIEAPVVPLKDELLMKLLTEAAQRPRDKFDVVAMLLDSFGELDTDAFAEDCRRSNLDELIRKRLEVLLVQAKQGKLRGLWKEYANLEFTQAQETEVKKKASELLDALSTPAR